MKASQKINGKTIEIIVSALISTYLIAYSAVKIMQIQSIDGYLIVLSLLSFILVLIHIASVYHSKKYNVIRMISYGIFIPEIMLTFEIMKWKPLVATIDLLIIIGIAIASIFMIKHIHNNRNYRKIRSIVKYINSQIIISGLFLVPSFLFMIIIFENNQPIATVKMFEDTEGVTETFSISDEMWNEMNLEEKTDVISQIVDIESKKLDLEVIPQIEIVYLPGPLYGTTSENNLIKLNASRISKGSVYDAVDTVTHELFHCHQYDLIQSWKAGEIKRTIINSDYVDRIIQYAYEEENYQGGGITDEEYDKYESQALEVDARQHALEAVAEYVVD